MKRAMRYAPLGLIIVAGLHAGGEAFARAGLELRNAAQASRSRAERLMKERDNIELQKVPPFKLFDNLYYVGIGWVASYLMPTDQGLILIDTVHEPYVDHLIAGIKRVGLDPKDIKYVLGTHAHFDHIGGAARIQEMYGARVGMLDGDWQLLASGGSGDVRAPRRDLVLKAGETFTLGNTTLKLSAVPGHTPGMLVIETTLYDGGKPYKAYVGSFPAAPGGPGGGTGTLVETQYAANAKHVQQMQDIAIFLIQHWGVDFWQRAEKLAQRRPGDPHPFVAPEVFRARIRNLPAASPSAR